jgi:nucleoside-diphosphate-sugar epimerase
MPIKKRILITGATGFIGANLCREFLKKGAVLYILTRKTSNKWRIKDILPDLREISSDLLDADNLEREILNVRPEIILHTATYGGYHFENDYKKIIETNILGTMNLVNACKNIDFEVFVNTGSSSEYGIKAEAMKESDILEPIDAYGVSKAAATLYCQAFAQKENRPLVTLRLFSPYGYYDEPARLIPSVALSCLKGVNPALASPLPVRDFLFIEDLIGAYAKIVENSHKVKQKIFNIGSGNQYSVGDIVDKLIKLSGKKVLPDWGALINPRVEPGFWRADVSLAEKSFGWKPAIDLETGLKRTIAWFAANQFLYCSDNCKAGENSEAI